jgi:hypothetical protein
MASGKFTPSKGRASAGDLNLAPTASFNTVPRALEPTYPVACPRRRLGSCDGNLKAVFARSMNARSFG